MGAFKQPATQGKCQYFVDNTNIFQPHVVQQKKIRKNNAGKIVQQTCIKRLVCNTNSTALVTETYVFVAGFAFNFATETFVMKMRRVVVILLMVCSIALLNSANAQCSICTKTAMQLGEKPAEGLNTGIVYLMLTPFAIVGFIGYRWWKANNSNS